MVQWGMKLMEEVYTELLFLHIDKIINKALLTV